MNRRDDAHALAAELVARIGRNLVTFDFAHFRAAGPPSGYWRLVVDEARYAESTGR